MNKQCEQLLQALDRRGLSFDFSRLQDEGRVYFDIKIHLPRGRTLFLTFDDQEQGELDYIAYLPREKGVEEEAIAESFRRDSSLFTDMEVEEAEVQLYGEAGHSALQEAFLEVLLEYLLRPAPIAGVLP